jgi:uncharacterized membrane protein
MLTAEEEKFLAYWQEQRQNKKGFLKKFSVGLPVLALIAVAFFINFLSGWFGRADKELRRHSSLIIVILIAVVAIVIFVTLFSLHHKWDRAEADYQSLLKRKQNISSG